MSAVDRLREANRYEMKLENGIPLTYRLPFMEELIIARLLPLSLLEDLSQRLKEGGTETEAETIATEALETRLADYETEFEAKQRVIALMVTSVDGEEANLTPEQTVEIPNKNFRQLITIAIRQKPASAEGEA